MKATASRYLGEGNAIRSSSKRHHSAILGLALVVGFTVVQPAHAQQNVFNRDNSGTNQWDNDTNKPWYYQTWNDPHERSRPDLFAIRNDVFFGHNNQLVQDVNSKDWYSLRSLTMQSTSTSARTFNSSGGVGISLSLAFTNESGSGAHTFNTSIGVDGTTVNFTNNGGKITFSGSNFYVNANTAAFSGGGNFDISAAMSGSGGSVTKSGSGTLNLIGANSYTGATDVNAGTLLINGNQSSATGNVTVASGAFLGGTGTVGGNTTIQGGGKHGASTVGGIGTQTFAGNLTYNTNSVFEWDVTNASSYDKVVGSSGKILGGSGGKFNITTGTSYSDSFWNSNRAWADIFSSFGTGLSNWASIFSEINGAGISWNSVSQRGEVGTEGYFTLSGSTLSWTAVPEPTSALAGLLLGAGLLRRRRKLA